MSETFRDDYLSWTMVAHGLIGIAPSSERPNLLLHQSGFAAPGRHRLGEKGSPVRNFLSLFTFCHHACAKVVRIVTVAPSTSVSRSLWP